MFQYVVAALALSAYKSPQATSSIALRLLADRGVALRYFCRLRMFEYAPSKNSCAPTARLKTLEHALRLLRSSLNPLHWQQATNNGQQKVGTGNRQPLTVNRQQVTD